MQPVAPTTPDIKETPRSDYSSRAVYMPLVWLCMWAVRLGQTAGFISQDFLMPARPEITPVIYPHNRQLRRARASCLRRAHRFLGKHGRIDPSKYTPRAYAHFEYVDMMPKHWSAGQFMENYLRDSGLGRVRVYGLDAAHHISEFIAGIIQALPGHMPSFAGTFGMPSLNLAAPADPAPP